MNRHLLYKALCASSLLALAACSDDDMVQENNIAGKDPIALTVGVESSGENATRAITTGTGKTLSALTKGTKIWMVMQSDKTVTSGTEETDHRYALTYGTAGDATDSKASVSFPTGTQPYWNDAHSRESQLSIYALAVPGKTEDFNITTKTSANTSAIAWSATTITPQCTWTIGNGSGAQTATTFAVQDLCYSNNISKYSTGESTSEDKRLKFNSNSDRKFDTGNMVFYHALSWFTFEISEGEGFSGEGFAFSDVPTGADNSVALSNFLGSGTFDIAKGEFISPSNVNYSSIYLRSTATTGYKYTLDAYLIPGTDINSDDEAFSVKIAGNEYKLSKKNLFTSINNSYLDVVGDGEQQQKKIKAGVHYTFKITIGKTKIQNITAQIVPWEEVTSGTLTPTNARISLQLLDKGESQSTGADFYRALNQYTGTDFDDTWASYDWQAVQYAKATAEYKNSQWTTNWYWDSNRDFYHFRSIIPSGTTITDNEGETPSPMVALEAKQHKSESDTYSDIKWGAPFASTTEKLTYSTTKGFDGKGAEATTPTHQIYKAIGPTNDQIKLISFHMMSEITIELSTESDAGKIDFGEDTGSKFTKIELLNCAQTGSFNLGDGCVTPSTETSSVTLSSSLSNNNKSVTWGVIPQALTNAELKITSADGNVYIVKLGTIEVPKSDANPSNTNLANPYKVSSDGKCTIDRWYPNYKYKYTFKVLKMGIVDLKATIVDWEKVTASQDVVIQ